MKQDRKFLNLLKEYGFSDYEIYIFLFLRHFNFLRNIDKSKGYYLSHYSWTAHEILIEFYSREYGIKIIFLNDMGSRLEVYFEKKRNLFTKKTFCLNDIIRNLEVKKLLNQKVSLENEEDVFKEYSELFKKHLLPLLKDEIWAEEIVI